MQCSAVRTYRVCVPQGGETGHVRVQDYVVQVLSQVQEICNNRDLQSCNREAIWWVEVQNVELEGE